MARDVILADTRRASWREPGGWGCFQPCGRLTSHGWLRHPDAWASSQPTFAARLFVGLGAEPGALDVNELAAIVGQACPSFRVQRGRYQHLRSGRLVEEEGAQIVVVSTRAMKVDEEAFVDRTVELAEELAERLDQDVVVVEIQRDGISQRFMGVEA